MTDFEAMPTRNLCDKLFGDTPFDLDLIREAAGRLRHITTWQPADHPPNLDMASSVIVRIRKQTSLGLSVYTTCASHSDLGWSEEGVVSWMYFPPYEPLNGNE